VKYTVDTNVLVRSLTGDDARQAKAAEKALGDAEGLILTLPMLCELVWVLRGLYRYTVQELLSAIIALVESDNVITDADAVEAGLSMLRAGGDFADGVIAFDGGRHGADGFMSFDRDALKLLQARGVRVQIPGASSSR
jgi:predicted nucleic-acid-binding protein